MRRKSKDNTGGLYAKSKKNGNEGVVEEGF
jgi:hypothetical protein